MVVVLYLLKLFSRVMAALVAAAPTPAPAVPAERRRDLPSSPAFRASSQVGMVVEEAPRPSVSPSARAKLPVRPPSAKLLLMGSMRGAGAPWQESRREQRRTAETVTFIVEDWCFDWS